MQDRLLWAQIQSGRVHTQPWLHGRPSSLRGASQLLHRRPFSGRIGFFKVFKPDDPQFTKRWWWVIYGIGLVQGAWIAHVALNRFVRPVKLLDPGSAQDASRHHLAERMVSELPVVQDMRKPGSGYVEWDAYSSMAPEARLHRVSTGAMGGMRCLGLQKLFYNASEKRLINVVYFGPGSVGWPGIVHGGAIATVVDETCGRVAVRNMSSRTGVTANLRVDYKAITSADDIYIIEVGLDPEKSSDRKSIVNGTVSDKFGKLLSRVSGVFVSPSKINLAPIPEGF